MADQRDANGRFLRGNQVSVGNSGQKPALLLDPEARHKITAYIRAGSFDWVAARAAGISAATFYNWMRRGEAGEPVFAEFFDDVQQARAEARLATEVEVKVKEPLAWLRYGPGRDRPGEPGWTDRPAQAELAHITVIVANNGKV